MLDLLSGSGDGDGNANWAGEVYVGNCDGLLEMPLPNERAARGYIFCTSIAGVRVLSEAGEESEKGCGGRDGES